MTNSSNAAAIAALFVAAARAELAMSLAAALPPTTDNAEEASR